MGYVYFSLDKSHCEVELENQSSCISLDRARKRGTKINLLLWTGTVEEMFLISHVQLCHPESQHTCTICSKIKSKTFRKSKRKNTPFCSRTVSILSQLRTNMSPLRTSGVLLPITAWLEWKKAWLLCQGLLNQDDLNPLGPHSRPLRGDWKVMNGRFLGGVMMRQKLRQCVLF